MCVTATIYHADPAQCNADFLTTASMKTIEDPNNPERWIAVSRDLEAAGFTMGSEVIVTGAGGSYTLTFNVGGVAGTFNKISGDYDDTASTKNFIQLTCVSTTEFWYSISQIAT